MSATENQKNTPGALPAGYRFNEFEIQAVIGGGGFGIVYRAWDHLLERTIAIKEYLPVTLAQRRDDLQLTLRGERYQKMFDAGLQSFIQEARLLARFNHPGLLHVLRFWEDNGTAYMGTLFYEGKTLKDWQQTNPQALTEQWIRQRLPPLFGAISTLHRAGYLHRDISLDNILIQQNGLPLLLDFGSARREIGNLSDNTEIMLKPGYAPIEQYSEDSESDQGPWSDIYALGAVLHALVCGNPPPVSVVRCIEDTYQPLAQRRPADYSLPLLQAIDRALALKPENRPQSIDAFAALLELPVTALEELIPQLAGTTSIMPAPAEEPALPRQSEQEIPPVLVNPAAAAAEVITARSGRTLSPLLLTLSAIALAAVAAVVYGLNSGDPLTADKTTAQATPASASTDGGQHSNAARPAAVAQARVYVRLNGTQTLLVNGKPVTVTADEHGFATLKLTTGDYSFETKDAGGTHRQQLHISQPGTWLINLP
ncbi:serine/threonine protein kinase [Erwinia sp. OLTSP20]|uniref:serine/threonine protein kinase n=1 Tax=unclassified Erwinia TaxID=2622719 RepID=UPI000C18B6EF|nr:MULTISPECIES: serine/threonine-protein kinase [unclassified Erwinia]PIJ49982.1 serine/threonine protein kinase [Erwinia sp. OAMSP11]PIJ71409.1 serine/threonine protein kinase [Erwinia sp. OLSSP12]PIJ80643.1 serine/threonine protein kinase [Erwinia sp. OLCASP19]PIJ82799.1 serine/threonine protein kinase [Erwinia sp. OLMTSP26]PIJ85485.1 serine/threonine protein kinase [Erwinia sp. OLMDSP33]